MSTENVMLLAALAVVLWIEVGRRTLREMIFNGEAADLVLLTAPIADRSARLARNIVMVGAIVAWPALQLAGIISGRRANR